MQSFVQKQKSLNLEPELFYLGNFSAGTKKNYFQIRNQHFWIYQKWMFNQYSEFGFESAFQKVPGSTFSEDPSPDPVHCNFLMKNF